MKTTTVLLLVLGVGVVLVVAFFLFRGGSGVSIGGGGEAPRTGSNVWDFFGRAVDQIAPVTDSFSRAFGGDNPSSESSLGEKENNAALRGMGLIP